MYKVGDKVVITKEAGDFLEMFPRYKNKVFTIIAKHGDKHYQITNEVGTVLAYVDETKRIYHIKKVSIILSEYLESIKKGA